MAANPLADLLSAAVTDTETKAPVTVVVTTAAAAQHSAGDRAATASVLKSHYRKPQPTVLAKGSADDLALELDMLDEGAAPEKNPPLDDEFDDEPISLQIGSAAANTAGTKDEFDDEFDEIVEPGAVPPPARSATGAPPPPSVISAAAFEADRLALLAAADQAKAKADAQAQVLEAERVTKLAAEREEEKARQAVERQAALKKVYQAATDEGPGAKAAAALAQPLAAKSKAEQADELAAASLKIAGTITEEEEEEEEEEEVVVKEKEEEEEGAAAAAEAGEAAFAAAGGGGADDASPSSAPEPPLSRAERLMAMFDSATAAVDRAKEDGEGSTGEGAESVVGRHTPIADSEAAQELFSKLTESARAGIVREDFSSAGLLSRMFISFRPRLSQPALREQRDELLALARTPMDNSVLHERVLMSVHRAITSAAECPARFGPHWEVIGFQGDDPATDLRGTGMLSLLQALHMGCHRPALLHALFRLSRNGTAFPLMTMSINMTQVALGALRAGGCTKEANARRQAHEALHSMHAACCCHLLTCWEKRGLTIADFGFLKKEIEALALRSPAALLRKLRHWEQNAAATCGSGSAAAGHAAAGVVAPKGADPQFSSLDRL